MMNASHHQKAVASSRNAGVALISALGLLAVASAVMALLFMRTIDNIRHGADDTAIVQTLLIAQGGASLGVALLQGDLRDTLDSLTSIHSDSTGSWSFGDSSYDEEEPTPSSVTSALRPVAQGLQATVDNLLCGPVDLDGQANLNLMFFFTDSACSSEELPAGTRLGEARFIRGERRENGGNQTYALPFVMVSQGELGEHRRRVVTQGEYHFTVGRRSFSRYALFTDEHISEQGSEVWFTNDTLFDGPVHTNGNFYISGSPWFGGAVSSAGEANGQGAWGYGDDGHPWYGGNDGENL